MLAMVVVKPTQTEWASPIVILPEPGKTLRLPVDNHQINAATIRYSYAIPHMEKCTDSYGDVKIFCTLNTNCGYRQNGVANANHDKTLFGSRHGLFQFTQVPVGLRNSLGTFPSAMDTISSSVKW